MWLLVRLLVMLRERVLVVLSLLLLLLLLLPHLLGRRRGRRHVATQLAGGGQRRGALGTRMAGLGIVADVRRAVGRVRGAALVGIGRVGDALRGWRWRCGVRR